MKKWLLFLLALLAATSVSAQLDTTKWYAISHNYGGGWCFNASQANVSGGYLTETAAYGVDICGVGDGNYVGPLIITTPFYFDYGRVVVRGKLAGYGVHTTIEMWGGGVTSTGYPPTCIAAMKAGGAPWADCTTTSVPTYEVDFAEFQPAVNPTTSVQNSFNTWVSSTPSYRNQVTALGFDASLSLNNWEEDVAPTGITYKANGVQTWSYSITLSGIYWLVGIDQEFDAAAPPLASSYYPQVAQYQYVYVYCTSDTTYPACTPGQLIFSDNFTAGTGSVLSQGVTSQGVIQ